MGYLKGLRPSILRVYCGRLMPRCPMPGCARCCSTAITIGAGNGLKDMSHPFSAAVPRRPVAFAVIGQWNDCAMPHRGKE